MSDRLVIRVVPHPSLAAQLDAIALRRAKSRGQFFEDAFADDQSRACRQPGCRQVRLKNQT